MGLLRFSFGTMGSGKSTLALQIHHNLSSRDLRGLLCTQLDGVADLSEVKALCDRYADWKATTGQCQHHRICLYRLLRQ